MPGMDMSTNHDMSNMKDMPMGADKDDSAAGAHVMHSMEGHMDMGPHMKMTSEAWRRETGAPGSRSGAQSFREV